MSGKIDLTNEEKEIVISILSRHLPAGTEAFLFGSRTRSESSARSDLDILIKGTKTIDLEDIALIREEFEESDLIFNVDLVDFHSLTPAMFQNISDSMVKIM